MASQGPLSPGTGANDASVGTVAWTNPGNILASDNSNATASANTGVTTNYLKATNFGFSIPTGATIDGIVVEFERKSNNTGTGRDGEVKLVKGGTIGGDNKATATNWAFITDRYDSYGANNDLWGLTWTADDINSSGFGAVLAASPLNGAQGLAASLTVDHIRITVYYTESSGASGFNIALI